VMQARLDDRLKRMEAGSGGRRWLWWPPPEKVLAEGLLARLAAARPADRFDVLVNGEEESTASDCLPANVRTVHLADATASVADVDGIIVAHEVAGGARVALEMSQLLVPLVLGDSEFLRETFDPESAVFARLAGAGCEPVVVLSAALDLLSRLTPGEVRSLLTNAWSLVRDRHSDDAYLLTLADVLGLGDD